MERYESKMGPDIEYRKERSTFGLRAVNRALMGDSIKLVGAICSTYRVVVGHGSDLGPN